MLIKNGIEVRPSLLAPELLQQKGQVKLFPSATFRPSGPGNAETRRTVCKFFIETVACRLRIFGSNVLTLDIGSLSFGNKPPDVFEDPLGPISQSVWLGRSLPTLSAGERCDLGIS